MKPSSTLSAFAAGLLLLGIGLIPGRSSADAGQVSPAEKTRILKSKHKTKSVGAAEVFSLKHMSSKNGQLTFSSKLVDADGITLRANSTTDTLTLTYRTDQTLSYLVMVTYDVLMGPGTCILTGPGVRDVDSIPRSGMNLNAATVFQGTNGLVSVTLTFPPPPPGPAIKVKSVSIEPVQ